MPNGGTDNCGECLFNPASLARASDATRELRQSGAFCEIRGALRIPDPFNTYCANFHTDSPAPDGPVFAGFHEFGRLPWHGSEPVHLSQRPGSSGLVVSVGGPDREFDDPTAYLAWWRVAHAGENPEYPWALHERRLGLAERATGHDEAALGERLRSVLRRGTRDRHRHPRVRGTEPEAPHWRRRLEWYAGLSHEERADWFLGRALDILGLDVEERLADKTVEHRPRAGVVEAWHAWLLRTTEGLVQLAAHVDRPTATAFRTFRFLDVTPNLLVAYRDIWLRPPDDPLRNDDEAKVIADALAEQVRDLDAGTVRYRATLPATSEDDIRARGFDPRRVVVLGFAAEERDGSPVTSVPVPWIGRVTLWRRGSESVFVEGVIVETRDPAIDPEAYAKSRHGYEENVHRLQERLDAYQSTHGRGAA